MNTNYLEKCAELGLETLEKRRNDQDLALVYKFVTKKDGHWAVPVQRAGRSENQASSWRAWADSTVCKDGPEKILICCADC
jgi:hypothetical protein